MRLIEISDADRDDRYPLRIVFLEVYWQGPDAPMHRTVHDIVETHKITAKIAQRISDWITK